MLADAEPAPLTSGKPKSKNAAPAALGLKGKIKEFCYQSFYRLFYSAERVLGVWVIFLFLRPIALIDLARRWKQLPQFDRLRRVAPKSFWQGLSSGTHYRKMIFDWHESMGVSLLYGRMGAPYWRKRVTVRGKMPFDTPGWEKRPIIIAQMHVGGYALIRTWLRSHGIKASLYVGGMPPILDQPAFLKREAEVDRAYGLEDIPGWFRTSHSLREILRFLKPGNVLVMALDGGNVSPDSDRQETGDFPIFVKKGVCRIGAQVNALVYPASFKRLGPCRYEARFGQPVPDELLHKDDLTEATHHLVKELWRDIRADPDDLLWSALESFPPTFEERQRVVTERPRTWP